MRDRPKMHALTQVIMVLAYGLMFVPLLTVISYSFVVPGEAQSLDWGWRWYEQLFHNELIGAALLRSLGVASAVAFIAGLVGTLGAVAIDRGRFPGRGLLNTAVLLPLVMPELVLGLSQLIWFVMLRMTLGLHSIVLAHVTFALSYVVVTVRSRLSELDPALEEAAADLGASWWQTLVRVVLPNLWPAVAAGMMMAFVLSFDDFLISFFTSGVDSDTLPLKLYSMIRFGLSRDMYALSSLLVVSSFLAVMVLRRTFKNHSLA